MTKRRKKSETKRMSDKLDSLWSKLIRSVGRCEYCHSTENLNAHHIFGKRNHSVRWDLDNGVCLCVSHHVYSTDFSAHLTPTLFTNWIIERNGEAWHYELTLKAHSGKKYDLHEKKELYEYLSSLQV